MILLRVVLPRTVSHCLAPTSASHLCCALIHTKREFASRTQVNVEHSQASLAKEKEGDFFGWSQEELRLRDKAVSENAWIPVYRFHGLPLFWTFLRLNLVLCASAVLAPCMVIWQQVNDGQFDISQLGIACALASLAVIVSVCAKRYWAQIIGVISVDAESRSIYRFGHLSFTAARQNRFARVVDIKPLSDSRGSIGMVAKLYWTSRPDKDYLLLFTNNVEILDGEAAYALFGSSLDYFNMGAEEEELIKRK